MIERIQAEPVGVIAALNAALAATWGVIVIVAEVSPDLAGGVTIALGAWVGFAGAIVRRRVTPT